MTVSQGVAIHLPDTFLFAHSRDAVDDTSWTPSTPAARCFYSLIREMRSMTVQR